MEARAARVVALLSNTLTAGFCVAALSEALARFGNPGIFNTDQGAQFTSVEFTQMLRDHGIEISMDGRGRCHDLARAPSGWPSESMRSRQALARGAAGGLTQVRGARLERRPYCLARANTKSRGRVCGWCRR